MSRPKKRIYNKAVPKIRMGKIKVWKKERWLVCFAKVQ